MGKQKKSFVNTENEVSLKRNCKYIGSFAINMMKAEERQTLMNERLEELKNVKKGIRVVLHVTTNGIKVFDEKETSVKMAHAIMRVAFSTCSPDTRMFSYVARSTKSSKDPSILQAHVFKTKKASHAQQFSAIISKAFRLAFTMATVKRKTNQESFENSVIEAKQVMSPIEGKRRWAKKEMAHGHDLSEHALRARRQNPLAMLPGKSEPIDQEMLNVSQSSQDAQRPRNISNADFDNRRVLQASQMSNQPYQQIQVQVHDAGYKDATSGPSAGQDMNFSRGPAMASTASFPEAEEYQELTRPIPGQIEPQFYAASITHDVPNQVVDQNKAAHTPQSMTETPTEEDWVYETVDQQVLNATILAARNDSQVIRNDPLCNGETKDAVAIPADVVLGTEIQADSQQATVAGEELYVNSSEINTGELIENIVKNNPEGDVVSSDELYVNQNNVLPPPAFLVSADEGAARETDPAIETEGGKIHNLSHAEETEEEDIYLSKDSLRKENDRLTVSEDDLLRDSYWFQPGLPRDIAEEMLASAPPGSFFIRESTSTPGSYALSLRIPNSIKESGVGNILIARGPNGDYEIPGFKSSFPSIPMLVAYYASFQDELPVKLRLTWVNPLMDDDDDEDNNVDGCSSPEEAIALIDAVLPDDPDYTNFDSCEIIQQELANQ